ncbi:MAG: BREX-1 system adenine-specific DNA-methyltransferase PglX [Clostridia bacterium]|nr:BREX-1 system adenine-specific DNA-methyltransferase PglX [Clostridia bacterium]
MDKNAIKKYAVWARRELISRVSQKALQYGISEKEIIDADADSVNGKLLTETEKEQRKALISQIEEKGFKQVMAEVAYTWFNRFSALRFMEVNGYLPTHVCVFTDEDNNFKPQIITEAIHLEMDGLNMDKVYEYKETDQTEELYKYLLITQCNALNKILPGMFQRIKDYTELLFPDNLLRKGSVIEQMITMIPEENWKDAVQIIGWLYQYYNSEPKDQVFANLKKNIKISKENIPAATQLFTPDWIARYMVENSLGRLWLEGHPNDELKAGWKYYLDEAEQETDVQVQLDKIREEYKSIKLEEIRCIDPCMGSGHILVYMFDVLMQIYESYGYNQREAAKSIIENNLYGLDIDERAAQLAYFAIMMKARQYDRRFFSRAVQPHVYAIHESNYLNKAYVEYFVNDDVKLKADMQTLMDELYDAKEYGSILNVTNVDFATIYARFDEIQDDISILREVTLNELLPFVQMTQAMAQRYDVVVTNPPYMGSDSMGAKLKFYVSQYYNAERYDIYAVFIKKCLSMMKNDGFVSMITQNSYLFALCFNKLRETLISTTNIVNAVHLGPRAFEEISGEVVQTIAMVFSRKIKRRKSSFVRLVEYTDNKENFFFREKPYIVDCDFFSLLPNSVYAYSLSSAMRKLCINKAKVGDKFVSKAGVVTGNDEYFLRYWQEVNYLKFDSEAVDTSSKYVPFSKGGSFVKWYGNIVYAIKLSDLWNDGKVNKSVRRGDKTAYFKQCIGWSYMGGGNKKNFSFLSNCVCGTGTPTILNGIENEFYYTLGFLNTKIPEKFIELFNPTLNTYASDICNLPYIESIYINKVVGLVKNNIKVAKIDWDSFETSWDFKKQPLVGNYSTISDAYAAWNEVCDDRFNQLKVNEEKLNCIFIDIYGLQDELTPEVEDKDVTIQKADLQRDIKSLISYAVGCMFGRYSLDVDGLAYAGGDWDNTKYKTFPADKDNIIPICDDEYFSDDIVARFVKFIETVYGTDTLEENLQFIADALGGKGTSREVIRNYFLNDFYVDHCKTYKKRPIYWLFDSGKKNGFKALIYMHRYQPDTFARMRTDYVHEQQARYRTAIENIEQRINGASTAERVKLNKQLIKLQEQAEELRIYEEKIHHLADQMIRIDLDDGVKHNYAIFKDVLANVK